MGEIEALTLALKIMLLFDKENVSREDGIKACEAVIERVKELPEEEK